MLKSTYRPQPVVQAPGPSPLPHGWTEHKAPSGHSYYYNTETKQSTYTRPVAQPQPVASFSEDYVSLSEPAYGDNFGISTVEPYATGANSMGIGAISRGNWHQERRKPQDRPRHRFNISACAPWVLIQTRLGRRFVHNTETGESLWKFPEHVMQAVVEWDIQRMKRKEQGETMEADQAGDGKVPVAGGTDEIEKAEENAGPRIVKAVVPDEPEDELASDEEYEEVEVTDDEDELDENASKRAKVEGPPEDKPVEFDEDDIAWQLQAMEQEQELNSGDYDVDEAGDWEAAGDIQLLEEDARALFSDLLNDYNVNPYRTWEQVTEDGHIIDDDRYVALPSMRSRKEAFSDWSREKIQALREQRAREAEEDPRIPYMAFLEKFASPKLYWPEFKRKYRKEAEMRDSKVSDKDREKWYREHIKRVQLPESTLKSDLSALLKAQPLSILHRSVLIDALPAAVITDPRYISLRASVRDSLIEAYISTLAPQPENPEDEVSSDARKRDRERREKALADRERDVRDAKRKQERDLAYGRDRLRAEERDLERAMKVNKDGLKAQLGGDGAEHHGHDEQST